MQPTTHFYAATRDAKKIIVVDLGFLGDTVHLVPALWEIKRHYPQAELHVLSSPVGAEVLKMAPCVDRVWAFPLGPPSPSWWEHWDIQRALRREKFHVAYNVNGADRTVFVTALLRAKQVIAYRGARQHFWQPWLIKHWIPRMKLPTPVFEGRRHILTQCGFELQPPRFDLRVSAGDQKWAAANIPAGGVHLSLSASFALKEWPMANNLGFVRYLLEHAPERDIVVTAAPNPREQERLGKLCAEIKNPRLRPVKERANVGRLAAILQRCALHVGPDSGMIHLAAAVGVPTVAIFRDYPDKAAFPFTSPEHTYFAKPCACYGSKTPACAATNEAACLGQISPELVGAEVYRRLAKTAAAQRS